MKNNRLYKGKIVHCECTMSFGDAGKHYEEGEEVEELGHFYTDTGKYTGLCPKCQYFYWVMVDKKKG